MLFISYFQANPPSSSSSSPVNMAKSVVIWLHGLGGFGSANDSIKTFFSSPEFRNTKWLFPTAPSSPVTCNYGQPVPAWFDIYKIPITTACAKDESGVLKAVQRIHAMIDKEVAAGTHPENIFICGFSQGGSLSLASVLLYPKTLGGAALFSGFLPFGSSIVDRITPNAKKTPVLWFHGTSDGIVLFEAGQAGPGFLEQVGMTCEFKPIRGLGHSISNDELKSLATWMKTRMSSSS